MGWFEVSAAFMAVIWIVNVVPAFRSVLYPAFYRKKLHLFDASYTPPVSLFVPCKGMEEGLYGYLKAMVTQDYPQYRVYFITESSEDEAVGVIEKICGEYSHVLHVVAGRAESCCQKNHNLLSAVGRDDFGEILMFADADVRPSVHWMRDLVLPLSRPENMFTTGFRWLSPLRFTLTGTFHSMLSSYLGTLMASSSGMWGGAMALRRSAFTKYGVGERWREAVVDDLSLTEIIIKNKLRRVFVPLCIAVSNNVITDMPALFAWFVRQVQYLKIYCFPLWIAAAVYCGTTALSLGAALAVAVGRFGLPGGFAVLCAVFFLVTVCSLAVSRFNYRDGQSYLLWCVLAFPALTLGVTCLLWSGVQKHMLWRGIRYSVDGRGAVTSVEFS